jgi:hypothetical protein
MKSGLVFLAKMGESRFKEKRKETDFSKRKLEGFKDWERDVEKFRGGDEGEGGV